MNRLLKNSALAILLAASGAAATAGTLWILNKYTKGTPREEIILGWLEKNEPEPTTFAPDVNDRKFWDAQQEKTTKTSPPNPGELVTGTVTAEKLVEVIAEGTQQEMVFNTGEWIPAIEAALKQVVDYPWSEAMQGQEFTDLHASQTAGTLARTLRGLGSKLDPSIQDKTLKTIREKVTGPFLKDAETYQVTPLRWGQDMCPWLEGPSNWTAVCINNILYAILATEPDPKVRAHAIALAESPLEEYLGSAEEDGYLSSGIRYWNYGFGNLMMLNERLDKATGGNLTLSKNAKIRKMGEFKAGWVLWEKNDNEYFPLFADNNNPTGKRVWLDELCSRRLGAVQPKREPTASSDGGGLGVLEDLLSWLPKEDRTGKERGPQESVYYASAGALVSRHKDNKTVLAAKGGSNSEEHNHNDIGSYTLFKEGETVAGDPGTVIYTSEGFSAARYEGDVMSSYGHPVPVVGGHLQTTAKSAKGEVLSHTISAEKDEVVYDLTSAYKTPGLTLLKRTVTFEKTGKPKLTVTDEFQGTTPMEFETPIITERGRVKDGVVGLGDFEAKFKGSMPIEIVEERFWRDSSATKRITAKTSNKAESGTITYVIEEKSN